VFSAGMQIYNQKVSQDFFFHTVVSLHTTVEQRTHYKSINTRIILSTFFPFHLKPRCVMLYA